MSKNTNSTSETPSTDQQPIRKSYYKHRLFDKKSSKNGLRKKVYWDWRSVFYGVGRINDSHTSEMPRSFFKPKENTARHEN